MKTSMVSSGWVFAMLVVLSVLAACVLPDQPTEEPPPKEALSYDELLANLDALQGPASRSLAQPDQTVFMLPSGSRLRTQDLSAYIAGIKNDLGGYVYAASDGKPYLVVPVPLAWRSDAGPESGLMWVPFTWGRRRSFPVISYQHGTQVYQGSAPSRFRANPLAVLTSPDTTGALQNYVECIAGALMASAGYIVVMPDYVGFGQSTGPDHPYVTMALGDSVVGILGATQVALDGKAVRPDGKVFLTGYSEGGYATMAGAVELQGIGAPPAAVVPCDGAYDLSGTMLEQMLGDEPVKVPSYLLYAVSGYHAVYGDEAGYPEYEELLKSPWAEEVADGLFDGTHTNADIASLGLPPKAADMLAENAIPDWLAPGQLVYQKLLANNAWVGWPSGSPVPVFFVHCPSDDVVPYENATVAQSQLGSSATIVDVPPVPFVDQLAGSIHVAAYPTAMLAAFTIIDGVNQQLP